MMEADQECRICGKPCYSYPCNGCGYNGEELEQPIQKKPTLQNSVTAIKTVTLHFPLGITMAEAQEIAMEAENITAMGISQGGVKCLNEMNLLMEDGPVKWDDTHAEFIHSYKRK